MLSFLLSNGERRQLGFERYTYKRLGLGPITRQVVCFVLKTNTPIKILIRLGIGAKNPYVNWPVLKTGV